jgi:soluble lytic murein transglycosylase-like protein
MRRAPTLLGVLITVIPAFASEPTSVREYAERCANYYARQYGVSPALVRAVIQVESAWQPGVVSAKGAMA